MNYNVAKKKKKNTAVIVVASILACVLAGGAVAGLGFHFDWWGSEADTSVVEEKKAVPTSTYNLEIASLDELMGVELTPEDFSSAVSTFTMTKQELVDAGVIESVDEELEANNEIFMSVLNVGENRMYQSYGKEFTVPDEGQYKLTVKINGVEYATDICGISSDYEADTCDDEDTDIVMNSCIFLDAERKQVNVDIFNGEEPGDDVVDYYTIMIFDRVMVDNDGSVDHVDGYTLFITHECRNGGGTATETFEFVSLEQLSDVLPSL